MLTPDMSGLDTLLIAVGAGVAMLLAVLAINVLWRL